MKVISFTDGMPTLSVDEKKNVYLKKESICSPVARIPPFTTEPSFDHLNVITKCPWMKVFTYNKTPIEIMGLLEKLMFSYTKKVRESVHECYLRPIRAAKLMKSMSNTLMFFHTMYTDLKLPLVQSTHLKKMSDLMAMYLDMEIKAFGKTKENQSAVASRITSSFYIYFGKSQDYMVDTILKSRFIQGYRVADYAWNLFDLILQRLLRDFSGTSLDFISYFRYVLVFKLWVAILKRDPVKRVKVIQLACMKHHAPSDFREKYCNNIALQQVLPAIPKSCKNITEFLMKARFQIRKQIKWFLSALEDPKLKYLQDYSPDSSSVSISQEISSSKDTFVEEIFQQYKAINFKPIHRRKTNKPGRNNVSKKKITTSSEVIVIDDESDSDISSDDEIDIIEKHVNKDEIGFEIDDIDVKVERSCDPADFNNDISKDATTALEILLKQENKIENNRVKIEKPYEINFNDGKDTSDTIFSNSALDDTKGRSFGSTGGVRPALELLLRQENKIENNCVKIEKPYEIDFYDGKEASDNIFSNSALDDAKERSFGSTGGVRPAIDILLKQENKIENNYVKIEKPYEVDFNDGKDTSDTIFSNSALDDAKERSFGSTGGVRPALDILLRQENKIENNCVKIEKPYEVDFSDGKGTSDTIFSNSALDDTKERSFGSPGGVRLDILDINLYQDGNYLNIFDDDELDPNLSKSSSLEQTQPFFLIDDPAPLLFGQPMTISGKDQGGFIDDRSFFFSEDCEGRKKFKTPAELKQATTSNSLLSDIDAILAPSSSKKKKKKSYNGYDEGPKPKRKSPRISQRNENKSSGRATPQNNKKPQRVSYSFKDLDDLEITDTWIKSSS